MSVKGLEYRVRVELVKEGRVVMDDQVARLLLLVDKYGSILRASRTLGIPYSRAWELIARVERILGLRVVEARRGGRGGGGARLTEEGKKLLKEFEEAYRRLTGRRLQAPSAAPEEQAVVYAGSHDIALEHLLGALAERGVAVHCEWLGSTRGLAAVVLGEALVAGIHLFDEETGEYNLPVVEKVDPHGRLALVKGYERLLGFVSRRPMSLEEVLRALLSGELKLVNRVWGSGTRRLLDYLLWREAERMGVDPHSIPRVVGGYEFEVSTHIEVAQAVARGEADVGLTLYWAAKAYGLHFTPVRWERFDFVVDSKRLGEEPVKSFLSLLSSEWFAKRLEELPGYRLCSDTGRVVREG